MRIVQESQKPRAITASITNNHIDFMIAIGCELDELSYRNPQLRSINMRVGNSLESECFIDVNGRFSGLSCSLLKIPEIHIDVPSYYTMYGDVYLDFDEINPDHHWNIFISGKHLVVGKLDGNCIKVNKYLVVCENDQSIQGLLFLDFLSWAKDD